ncbi:uncharacterized protein LOC132745432 [Ruditapes philippinarum]|uniref:uncharacterized protein LOC132745432 n=1 Tax=Ruditapes philippinarum TaxID=129788 RepID=UPI00295ACB75|nr:uncharacterized protein LOC132745432 [Ruditapes philippinarum]
MTMACSTKCNVCFDDQNIEEESVRYCVECNEFFCQSHVDEHKSVRFTKNHKTVAVSDGIKLQEKQKINSLTKDASEKMHLQFNFSQYGDDKTRKAPGKPEIVNVGSDSLTIEWKEPDDPKQTYTYQLSYKMTDVPNSKWKIHTTEINQNMMKLTNLKSNTSFCFRVRAVFDDEEGPYSPSSDIVKTVESPAVRLKEFSAIVQKGTPERRSLPITQVENSRNNDAMTQKFELGTMNRNFEGNEKTIMLVGETGAGKSTMLDGMVNYILGVNFSDTFRYTIVHMEEDELKKQDNQAFSQTDWITQYTLFPERGGRIEYALNIIDTPGFGDTRGQKRDKKLVDQIHTLFSSRDEKGVLGIDAICFLIKAPDARLTHTQRYIFESIMSLFGKDVEKNMCSLITFADGQKPPVLAALKESKLPFGKDFTFNNSALFCENVNIGPNSLSPIYWDMGTRSFAAFFESLGKMHTTSLAQTKSVLDTRKQIENTIQNLLPLVDVGLSKLASIRKEIKFIEQHKLDIEQNKDFLIPTEHPKVIKHDTKAGQYVTNCLLCNFTCHQHCIFSDDSDKQYCAAMGGSRSNCTECAKKCHWSQHKNMGFYWELKIEVTYEPYSKKKDKYEEAMGKKLSGEGVLQAMRIEIEELKRNIAGMMQKITSCNNKLKEIALRPNPLSLVEQLDILIEAERNQKKRGFEDRIRELESYKKEAQYGKLVEHFFVEESKVNDELHQHGVIEKPSLMNRFCKTIGWKTNK